MAKPDDVQFTIDGTLAFVTMDFCDQVAVIDVATQTVVNWITAIVGAAFDTHVTRRPAGDRMYVNTCTVGTFAVIDVATQTVVGSIPTADGFGTHAVEVSPDGTRAYAGSAACIGPANFEVLDLTAGTPVTSIPTSSPVWGLALSPDGTALIGGAEDNIVVIDTATNTEIATLPASFAVGVTFRPDGLRAYVVDDGTNELITLDTTNPLAPVVMSVTPVLTTGFAWESVGNPAIPGLLWVADSA